MTEAHLLKFKLLNLYCIAIGAHYVVCLDDALFSFQRKVKEAMKLSQIHCFSKRNLESKRSRQLEYFEQRAIDELVKKTN